jgi:hypothetical protein
MRAVFAHLHMNYEFVHSYVACTLSKYGEQSQIPSRKKYAKED